MGGSVAAPARECRPRGRTRPSARLPWLLRNVTKWGGAHKVIEVTLTRTDSTEIERGYTGQRGQDEQNRDRRAPRRRSLGVRSLPPVAEAANPHERPG